MRIQKHKRLIQNILFGVGIIFILSPILLYCFLHSEYERYLWIFNQSFPDVYFVGGRVQMWLDIILVLIGFISIMLSIRMKWRNK
jgi:hypothetical protein